VDARGSGQRSSPLLLLSICLGGVVLCSIILYTTSRVLAARGRASRVDIKSELKRWNTQSDDEVLQATVEDVRRFIRSRGSSAPTFGISRGHYSSASQHSLSKLTQVEKEHASRGPGIAPRIRRGFRASAFDDRASALDDESSHACRRATSSRSTPPARRPPCCCPGCSALGHT